MNNRVPESQALTHSLPHEPVPGADVKKPPTQVAGVQGFSAFEAKPTPPPVQIDWHRLCGLPPFQMFAAERMRNTTGKDSFDHALEFVRARGAGQDVLDEYEAWHAAKGYWKNETSLGELIRG